jgi:uncharacterized protein DUF4232
MMSLRVLTTRRLSLVLATGLLVSACTVVGPSPTATPTPAPSATVGPTPGSSASPSTSAACDPAKLSVKVMGWDGAAGHRVATVQLSNGGTSACSVPALAQPQLVDGANTVLIDSAPPTAPSSVSVAAGGTLTTMVQDGNYCGPTPTAPVTVAFVFSGSIGRIVAAPLSATDTSGVPPCLGPAGSAGDIEMQPWSP